MTYETSADVQRVHAEGSRRRSARDCVPFACTHRRGGRQCSRRQQHRRCSATLECSEPLTERNYTSCKY